MAGLLEQLLADGVRRTTPENKPLNMSSFLSGVGQAVGVYNNKDQIARQNTIRNLIADGESKGVPYTQLGAQAAKYDLATGMKMAQDGRSSYEFNRRMDEQELSKYKKAMAGWLGAKVLRAATEYVENPKNNQGWDFDYAVKVCNKAAAAIYPYDPNSATALLQFGKQGMAKKASQRPASMQNLKDDRIKLLDLQAKLAFLTSPDAQVDENVKKAAQLYSARIGYILNHLGSDRNYPVYAWMPDYLRGNKEGWADAVNKIKSSLDWEGFDPTRMIHPYNISGLERDDNSALIAMADEAAKKKGYTPKSTVDTTSYGKEKPKEGSEEKKYSYVHNVPNAYIGGVSKVPNDGFYAQASNDIHDAVNSKQLMDIIAALTEAKNTSNGDNVNALVDLAKNKQNTFDEAEKLIGKNTPEARLLAKTMSKRSQMSEVRRLKMMGTVANGIFSGTPFSIVDNMAMVQSPDYQISDAMQNTAYRVKNGEWTTELLSAFGDSKGFWGKLAQNATVYDMLAAGAQDALNTVRPIYNGMLSECNSKKEVDDLNHALKVTFGWERKLFEALKDENGSLGDAAYIKKMSEKASKDKKNIYTDKGVIKAGDDKETPYDEPSQKKKMTAEDLNKWMESQKKGGNK